MSILLARDPRTDGEPAADKLLQVGGLTPFTSIDYPGQLAAVVFVQGCPWRCAYCHNPHLQPRQGESARPWPEVLAWLERRVGLVDAVVFSGGEPTTDPGLAAAMTDARSLGLAIGLHTAGIYPRRLAQVLPLIDWIGFDVKAPLSRPRLLDRVVGLRTSTPAVRDSLLAVLGSGVACECRTTAHPALLSDGDLLQIGEEVARLGATRYALQIARPVDQSHPALGRVPADYPAASTLERLDQLFPSFVVRRETSG
jgi:pyruvate formate lyase activating enzyme